MDKFADVAKGQALTEAECADSSKQMCFSMMLPCPIHGLPVSVPRFK
jgi:hypothetical protein